MELPKAYLELRNRFGAAVLNWTPLGPDNLPVIWVDASQFRKVVENFRETSSDILVEFGNAAMMDGALLVTFWFSEGPLGRVAIRATLHPLSPESPVEMSALSDCFPSARVFEQEISKNFGVAFVGVAPTELGFRYRKATKGSLAHGHA